MTVNKPTRKYMKHRTASLLPLALGAAALGLSSLSALAQGPGPGGPPPGHHPPSPLFEALDANHDGVLSADEIKNASAALMTLDRNKDGQLTMDEMRPPRPEGGRGGPERDGDQRPPPPRHHDFADQAGPGKADDAHPRGPHGPHPMPPIIAALDANHDGVLSADEIKNATAALLTLDKNGDGQLTGEEMRPPRPEGGRDGGPADDGDQRPPPPPPQD